jgi:hypothetical protein
MATTTFAVRQFFNIPAEALPLSQPTGTFIVTGSVSNLLVNNNRTNLANDTIPGVGSSGTQDGWWPGPDSSGAGFGIIVGGNDTYANSTPDGRTSTVSCWGWTAQETQGPNDTEFISLAGYILGTTYANTGSAKTALRNAGFYYQYPVGFDGQSPNTGTGSDTV